MVPPRGFLEEENGGVIQTEIETFKDLKKQLYDMLTKNQKSQFNTIANMRSIDNVEIVNDLGGGLVGCVGGSGSQDLKRLNYELLMRYQMSKPFEPTKVTSTAFIEDEIGKNVLGAYFFSNDKAYKPQHCFHIVRTSSLFSVVDCVLDFCQWAPDLRKDKHAQAKS
jgi:hypothetical protein